MKPKGKQFKLLKWNYNEASKALPVELKLSHFVRHLPGVETVSVSFLHHLSPTPNGQGRTTCCYRTKGQKVKVSHQTFKQEHKRPDEDVSRQSLQSALQPSKPSDSQ